MSYGRWPAVLLTVLVLLTLNVAHAQPPSDANEVFCPVCGTPNPAEAQFCKNCGTHLHPPGMSMFDSSSLAVDSVYAERVYDALNSLSREELLLLVQMIEEHRPFLRERTQLPEGSVAAMTEGELRTLISDVLQEDSARSARKKSTPSGVSFIGALLQVIGGVTLFALLLIMLSV